MKTEFNPAILKPVLESKEPVKGSAFTVQSISTGKDFTFKIRRFQPAPGVLKTLVFVERSYMEFFYLGVYGNGKIYKKGEEIKTDAAIGAAWILSKVEAGADLTAKAHFYHLGKCLVCGRTLTDATSIQIGIGPKCRGGK